MCEKLEIKKTKPKSEYLKYFRVHIIQLGDTYLYLISARAPTLISSISEKKR